MDKGEGLIAATFFESGLWMSKKDVKVPKRWQYQSYQGSLMTNTIVWVLSTPPIQANNNATVDFKEREADPIWIMLGRC